MNLGISSSGKRICDTVVNPGDTLLKAMRDAGVYIDAPCGGEGRCGKCLVRIAPTGEEVLACRTCMGEDIDIDVGGHGEISIGAVLQHPSGAEKDCPAVYGVAFDIGTTTVVAHLVNLNTGTRIATTSGINDQGAYGADVITRIKYCAENGHDALTSLTRKQLASLIRQACLASGTSWQDIKHISIAANTTMQHIAAGLSPVGMGAAPFTPASLFGMEIPAWDGLPAADDASIFFAPAIASYVGGDITAGILASGLGETEGPSIYLDIGTNGEIALKHNGKYYCCATAAGPAFEGAEITMGMAAVSGAIANVKWEGGLKLATIGNGAPRGICGSGLIDAFAVLLETGAVDETGRMLTADDISHPIAKHMRVSDTGDVWDSGRTESLRCPAFWLTESIFISASDIRKLQLAKAAIAAGVQTLLHYVGITEGQLSTLMLAGGFGSNLDKHSAARVGLIPKCALEATQAIGNAAGEGAVLALLSKTSRSKLADICAHCEHIELSTSKIFNEQFIEQMTFRKTFVPYPIDKRLET